MNIERQEHTLTLSFDTGVTIGLDLGNMDVSADQLSILDKLAYRSRELDSVECSEGICPAQSVLEPAEFDKVRDLYVGLSEIPIDSAGTFIDFCLHVHKVHRIEQRVQD